MTPSATTSAPAAGPMADAAAPPHPRRLENRVQTLALILRLSLGLLPRLPLLLIAVLAALAGHRIRRPAHGHWYLPSATVEDLESLSHRERCLLAEIGWLLAGRRNRGARPRPRTHGHLTLGLRPAIGPRAPPRPA